MGGLFTFGESHASMSDFGGQTGTVKGKIGHSLLKICIVQEFLQGDFYKVWIAQKVVPVRIGPSCRFGVQLYGLGRIVAKTGNVMGLQKFENLVDGHPTAAGGAHGYELKVPVVKGYGSPPFGLVIGQVLFG